jgi:molecular chaperone GrpE (heat shock protein)
MNKIFFIIGLVFLIAGSAMLGWINLERQKEQQRISRYESKYDSGAEEIIEKFVVEGYDRSEIENQLRQDQEGRLQADLDDLASGEIEVSPYADILYGENWQEELDKYMNQKELREVVFTGSIVCISMGGTIFAWYVLQWLFRSLAKGMSGLKKSMTSYSEKQSTEGNEEPEETYIEKELLEQGQEQSRIEKKTNDSLQLNTSDDNIEGSPLPTKNKFSSDKKGHERTKKPVGINTDENPEKIAVLLSDEETSDSLAKLENSLKAQTEQLEERTAQSVQEALKEHSEPLDSTLKDLAQQVSAIREYASCQQERVEKLQDGYDWNIIKTFCLRIIRCIDNLENRIERLSGKGEKVEYLEDIRDEMVFALESSGIEQYHPEINSDYRGQEKYAEAVKQKEHCENSKQKGKIAKVIRPGYQYVINDENIKIVRTAQVKLFG